jgi:predicted nucleotide-binding protein
MTKFKGAFEDLQAKVAATGHGGTWSDIANGKQFRADNGAILNWYPKTGTLQYQGPKEDREKFQADLSGAATIADVGSLKPGSSTSGTKSGLTKKVFVVHGHDQTAREQLELVLHRLKLDPFVLANTGGGGLTIIEALEREIGAQPGAARFGIVLMTPDDMGYVKSAGVDKAEPRARQNVVLEMGMLMAALGRPNVAILKKGHIEIPSDASGIIYIGFNDHVRETVPRLVDRLRGAGFDLDPDCISRATV